MGESSSSQAFTLSQSPALALSSPPFSISNSSSADTNCSFVINPSISPVESPNLQNFSSNIHSLLSADLDNSFSDVLIHVSNCVVPLHRCILAAQCPFFKSLFLKDKAYLASLAPEEERIDNTVTKLTIELGRLLGNFPNTGKVSYDAFMTVIGFLYSGYQNVCDIKCIDYQCSHEACRPVVEFAVEMFGLSSVFDIIDLKSFWKHHLKELLEKTQVDEALLVLVAAKVHETEPLVLRAQHLIAVSNMGTVDIKKQLPKALADEVLGLRCKLGLLQPETINHAHENKCLQIRQALDSDDVELVQLLLKEGRISLDEAQALHYAVAYCNPRIVKDILELGLADVNARNNRGFTVLHIAAMRRDPSILVSLLSKGANVLDTTPDGRTSLQLCSRMMRRFSNDSNAEAADVQTECLCVEILHQAGTKNLFEDTIFPPIVDKQEFLERLCYLENRVAFCRLLFPREASLVLGITHLETTTSEFVGFGNPNGSKKPKRESSMDLNQLPSASTSINDTLTSNSTLIIDEALVKRVEALQWTVTLGRRMFPHCTSVLNLFTDDEDPIELLAMRLGNSEELKSQKRRYSELKSMLAEAFQKDVAAMERHKA